MPARPLRQVWRDLGYGAQIGFFGFLATIIIVTIISKPYVPRTTRFLFGLQPKCVLWLYLISALTLVCTGCAAPTAPPPAPPPSTAPFGHVFILVEENANYSDVIGSSKMPYLNGLANQYGLATRYYADTHPSIGNYFMWTTGQILTNDDSQTPLSFPVSADNTVRELIAAGKTWKQYADSIPSVGYIGGDSTCCGGQFYTRHAPLPYMTDAQTASQRTNIVPSTQLATDISNGTLPNYGFITPDGCDDAHDCGLDVADNWLKTNIDPLIRSPQFQKDGLLVIVFDESESDNAKGGGRVAAVIISPFAKCGYKSTTVYRHESVLRLMLEGLGVKTQLGSAATAPKMWEFFNFTPHT
jgi:acid phosphatase